MLSSLSFVLHSIKFKEHDRIYTLFTREFGRIQARGRGVRKTSSKIGPHLQPLLPVTVSLVDGKQWFTITGAQNQQYQLPKYTLEKLEQISFFSEILKKTLPEKQENEDLFDQLKNVFEYIQNNSLDSYIAKSLFLIQYLKNTGHALELYQCIECQKEQKTYSFQKEQGGLICTQCYPEITITSETFIMSLKILNDDNLEYIKRLDDLSKEGKNYIFTTLLEIFLRYYPIKINTIV